MLYPFSNEVKKQFRNEVILGFAKLKKHQRKIENQEKQLFLEGQYERMSSCSIFHLKNERYLQVTVDNYNLYVRVELMCYRTFNKFSDSIYYYLYIDKRLVDLSMGISHFGKTSQNDVCSQIGGDGCYVLLEFEIKNHVIEQCQELNLMNLKSININNWLRAKNKNLF